MKFIGPLRKYGHKLLKRRKLLLIVLFLIFAQYLLNSDRTREIGIIDKILTHNEGECGLAQQCKDGSVSYSIKTGNYPIICFNGKFVVDDSVLRPPSPIVVALFDSKTMALNNIEYFNSFNDGRLENFLGISTKFGDYLVLTSYGQPNESDKYVSLLQNFGSAGVVNLENSGSYIFIGQRNLQKGKAVELASNHMNEDFSIISGCMSLPLGELIYPKSQPNKEFQNLVYMEHGKCGIDTCQENEFPVHILTGTGDSKLPIICVNGEYPLKPIPGVNNTYRGINVVVVGNGSQILNVANFDTYARDSTNLEIFLENLLETEYVFILITNDEASSELKPYARKLLKNMGSQYSELLSFRDAWYFIVNKKRNSSLNVLENNHFYSENISLSQNRAFPAPLDRKFCIPKTEIIQRPNSEIINSYSDLPLNSKRVKTFCSKYADYGEFCKILSKENLYTKKTILQTQSQQAIYSVPILVISGMSHYSLRKTLESIIRIPGLNNQLVYVTYDSKFTENKDIIDLFEFKPIEINSAYTYNELFEKSLEQLFEEPHVRNTQSIIVIEEDLRVSPDFLNYFSQLYDKFMADDSLAAISSWNPNSYAELNGSPNLVYRTNDFPGLGFLLKRETYENYIMMKFNRCCKTRAWDNWILKKQHDILMPDISRVHHKYYDGAHSDSIYRERLFNRKRKSTSNFENEIKELDKFDSKTKYEEYLSEKLKNSIEFPNIDNCYSQNTITLPNTQEQVYKIVYSQKSIQDYEDLKQLGKCFNLFYDENHDPKGLYNGILRFHTMNNDYILIGSMSSLLN